jgi:CheY-like chemotaxis protein
MTYQHPKVLLVNDDENVSEALGHFLRRRYEVELACDGREALLKLEQGACPCVILLDLMMPVMSGFEFRQEQLRTPELADIPVVVMSAAIDPGEGRDDLRAAAYVRIPEDIHRLVELLEEHCLK